MQYIKLEKPDNARNSCDEALRLEMLAICLIGPGHRGSRTVTITKF